MTSSLTLVQENWLGAASPKKHIAAVRMLAEMLKPSVQKRFTCEGLRGNGLRHKGIDYDQAIDSQVAEVIAVLHNKRPDRVLNLGCDCGTEFAPIAYLLSRYKEKMAVFWFDAHGDLNLPNSPTGGSPSGHFHGMVLRALTGHQAFGLSRYIGHPLAPSRIVLAGSRELDLDEYEYIAAEKVRWVPPKEIGGQSWLAMLAACAADGVTHAYIHVDFDVLDPGQFPWVGCPSPGGVSVETLRLALAQLHKRFTIVGISAVEISADGEDAVKSAHLAKDIAFAQA